MLFVWERVRFQRETLGPLGTSHGNDSDIESQQPDD